MRLPLILLAALLSLAALLRAQAPVSSDWPQWRGPQRTGVSPETGLLDQWPKGGPRQLWTTASLGAGYGSAAVAGDRIYVQGLVDGRSVVTGLNRPDGRRLWVQPIGRGASNDRGPGPRSTPTVDGDRLYVLTESGDLACLRAGDGTIVWQRNILSDFRARNINWLVSESPLVDGNVVIVTPGGRNAGMVALDKMTGATVWAASGLSDEAGYASPIVADVQGVRTIMTLTAEAGIGVRAADGRLMWRYRNVANNTANAATPVYANDRVFYSSAYGTGGALLSLRAAGGEVRAEEVYFTRDMQNHHGGLVLIDGYLYGYNNSILTCLEFATGKVMWRDRSVGKGAVSAADRQLYIVSENYLVGLVDATPSGYRERGRFEIRDLGLPSWAHPAISGGVMYIRNQGSLSAYDVRTL